MEGKSSYKKELGTIITYPFESSAVVFIIEDEVSLEKESDMNILNASFVIVENDFDSPVACGNVETSNTKLAFVDLNGMMKDKNMPGQIALTQESNQDLVTMSGQLNNLQNGKYGLWISKEGEKTRKCAKSDNEIEMYMVSKVTRLALYQKRSNMKP